MLTAVIPGVGFTVIENEVGVPLQLLENGVTVINALTIPLVALVVVKGLMPVPLEPAANPIDVVVFVHT